jgi:hypothetical protein
MAARRGASAGATKDIASSATAPSGLRIGEPGDASEQQADRVADEIMAEGTPRPQWSLSQISMQTPPRSAGPATAGDAPSIVHAALRSSGRPLDQGTRNFFEPRFGHDFSHVRIHADPRSAASARAVNARAYTVGHSIVLGPETGSAGADRRLLAHELAHVVQQERTSSIALQRQAAAAPELQLVDDFAAKFPDAAKLIKSNPAAMKLVKEAFDAGAKFGGYAEDGPAKTIGRAYTAGNTVYVPKTHANVPVLAMRDFLFELNNAIRAPKAAALDKAAAAGGKTDVAAAKKYAHDSVELEVEGLLRVGEVWFETKAKYLGHKAHDFDKYDRDFYLQEYQSFKDKKKTKEDIVTDALNRKYETGSLKGKTVEQYYVEEYQRLAK